MAPRKSTQSKITPKTKDAQDALSSAQEYMNIWTPLLEIEEAIPLVTLITTYYGLFYEQALKITKWEELVEYIHENVDGNPINELDEFADGILSGSIRGYNSSELMEMADELKGTPAANHILLEDCKVVPVEFLIDCIKSGVRIEPNLYLYVIRNYTHQLTISHAEAIELAREPIWDFTQATLVTFGISDFGDFRANLVSIIKNPKMDKLLRRIVDASLVNDLPSYAPLRGFNMKDFLESSHSPFPTIEELEEANPALIASISYLKPREYMAWLRSNFPEYWLVNHEPTVKPKIEAELVSQVKVQLLSDFWKRFWADVDVSQDDVKMPLKKTMTAWLKEEFEKRVSGQAISQNQLDALTTYLSPPEARTGGNRKFFD